MSDYVLPFTDIGAGDHGRVGGKNAPLGEMIRHLDPIGVQVPAGFATTADAYRDFLAESGLGGRIARALAALDVNDLAQLSDIGEQIRGWILETPFPPALNGAIDEALAALGGGPVAVRASVISQDLPEASFAGQQESYLNIEGPEAVRQAIRQVYASLFNDRAIAYRVHRSLAHDEVLLSAGVQRMVRSETGASGVMFTLDQESGFREVIYVSAVFGLGEPVILGEVNPDEFYLSKRCLRSGHQAVLSRRLGSKRIKMVHGPAARVGESVTRVNSTLEEQGSFSLSDPDLHHLARIGQVIEDHFGCPMEIEWARDGDDGQLYILQARPETLNAGLRHSVVERYLLKESGRVLVEGRSVGQRIGSGPVRRVYSREDLARVQPGDVLVTDMTDPEWEPVLRRVAAIVTDRGGRTCHAALIARELGIPAIVGCGDAGQRLQEGEGVTVSCAEGDVGLCYEGRLDFEHHSSRVDAMPPLPLDIMLTVANPDRAFDFQVLPNRGVGLARLEFIITRMVGVHPKALVNYEEQPPEIRRAIELRARGYNDPRAFFVEKLAEGVATLAAAFADKPVIVRLSDFKSNEYSNLIGGRQYEISEENPMLGFRGAARYISDSFRTCFDLECQALRKVREAMGLTNVQIMVPFVRTLGEARQVEELLAANGLVRGVDGLRLIMMCELPSNALLAEAFLHHFDGFSIGSNDLTQLTLGLDRDSGVVAHLFDERDEAVKQLHAMAIGACRRAGKYVGICGQGPSDHPDFARWLMEQGVDSLSLNPDSVLDTWFYLAQAGHDGTGADAAPPTKSLLQGN